MQTRGPGRPPRARGFDAAARRGNAWCRMSDLTLQQIILRAVAFVLISSVHGFALAGMARLLGDPGPQHDGRLTLNPTPHFSVLGALGAIVFQLGWIQPVTIDHTLLRGGRLGLVLCVLGSLAATAVLAALLQLLRLPAATMLPDSFAYGTLAWIGIAGRLSVWFTLFNLLPVPPLTGAHLLTAIAPRLQPLLRRYQYYGLAVLAVLIVAGVVTPLLQPAYAALESVLLRT